MADLNLKPDFMYEQKPSWKTLVSSFENGAEQRRSKWSQSLVEYKLQFTNRPQAELDALLSLFNTKKGAFSSFTWAHPASSEDVVVRFKEDSLSYVAVAFGVYNFEFELVQVK